MWGGGNFRAGFLKISLSSISFVCVFINQSIMIHSFFNTAVWVFFNIVYVCVFLFHDLTGATFTFREYPPI